MSQCVLILFYALLRTLQGLVWRTEERRKKGKLEWDRKVHKRAGQEESVGQIRIGERRGNERRGEDRKGEENIRENMRGETLTSEMLSGPVADMTASVPIDRAISLPSPIACYSPAWHSTASASIVTQALF